MRSELEALSAVFFTKEESSKFENAAMELSSVPEALVTIRAARDKNEGQERRQR